MKQLILIIALVIGLFLALLWGFSQRTEKLRHKNNYEAVTTNYGLQQQLRKGEIKQNSHLATVIGKLKKENIKLRNIEQVTQTEYMYCDTGSVKIEYNDRIVKVYPDSLHFPFSTKCYDLSFLLYKGKGSYKLDYHDTLSGILYRKRPNKFWFIEYGKWQYRGLMHSQCRDSLFVPFNNVKRVR